MTRTIEAEGAEEYRLGTANLDRLRSSCEINADYIIYVETICWIKMPRERCCKNNDGALEKRENPKCEKL